MSIEWRNDFDRAAKEAQLQRRMLLLDFSAAPM